MIGTLDPTWGERVTAMLRLHVPPTQEIVGRLDAFCRPRMAGFKRPRRWGGRVPQRKPGHTRVP